MDAAYFAVSAGFCDCTCLNTCHTRNASAAAAAAAGCGTCLLRSLAQTAASYGRLEVCVRLVEAGSPWPSGKGAKAGGGDVVSLLTNSKLCKQRQLKVRYDTDSAVVNTLCWGCCVEGVSTDLQLAKAQVKVFKHTYCMHKAARLKVHKCVYV
jgi:hypothetical protein